MFEPGWKVALPLTIVVIFGLGIGGFALQDSTDFQYRFTIELKDLLTIVTEITKGQVE